MDIPLPQFEIRAPHPCVIALLDLLTQVHTLYVLVQDLFSLEFLVAVEALIASVRIQVGNLTNEKAVKFYRNNINSNSSPVCRKYDNSRSALPHRHPLFRPVALDLDLDPGPALPPTLQGLQSSRGPLNGPERCRQYCWQ